MRILIKKTDNLTVPARANKDDLGYDIIAASEPKIIGELSPISKFDGKKNIQYYKSIDYIEYETNLFISPQKDINWRGVERKFHSLIFSRSSISKYWLSLANSVAIIDCVPAGTRIKSPNGDILVEELYNSDERIIFSFNEEKFSLEEDLILGMSLEKERELILIETESGCSVEIPPTKEVYTKRGWIKAENLKNDDEILQF